ncbi:hypothetical protein K438DRAFT_1748716 [Mycena galopus ATCC 62051]|nr:hypothetical protein K438DRAFT_1748716 [Mycena galopus ATCC 62051]
MPISTLRPPSPSLSSMKVVKVNNTSVNPYPGVSDLFFGLVVGLIPTRRTGHQGQIQSSGYDVDAEELSESFEVLPSNTATLDGTCAKAEKQRAAFAGSKAFALAVLRRFRNSGFIDTDLTDLKCREAALLVRDIMGSPVPRTIKSDLTDFGMSEDILNGLYDEWHHSLGNHLLNQLGYTTQGSEFQVLSADDPRRWTSSDRL